MLVKKRKPTKPFAVTRNSVIVAVFDDRKKAKQEAVYYHPHYGLGTVVNRNNLA